MKKRLLGLLLGVMLTFICVGCGAESTLTEPSETATPTEVAEQTPEATAEPFEEATAESETAELMEPTAPEPTEEPIPEPQAIYTYTDMSAAMYAQQTVNIRDLPDTSGNKIGSLSTNDEITISAKCNETGWYQFEYNGSTAFVSDKYVSENKVEIQQAAADNSTSTASTGNAASHWYDGYDYGVWYDMGEYYFYLCKTDEEVRQVCGNCINGRFENEYLWKPELLSRYPDRKVYYGGTESRDGIRIALASTSASCDWHDPAWFRPKFIWE